jgi:hypothetical protein
LFEGGKMENNERNSDDVLRIDTNDLRINLTKYLTENLGDTIYITRYNKLVGELRVYNDEIKRKTELRLAKKMLEAAEREKE